jgi:hypothetical protein
VSRDIIPEDFDSQLLSLEVTATAQPLGSTVILQQTQGLYLSLVQRPEVSVELSMANTSTVEAAGMPDSTHAVEDDRHMMTLVALGAAGKGQERLRKEPKRSGKNPANVDS